MSFPSAVESVELGEKSATPKVDIEKEDRTSVEILKIGDKSAASMSDLKIGIEKEDRTDRTDLNNQVGEEKDSLSGNRNMSDLKKV